MEVLFSYNPIPGFQEGTVRHTTVTRIEKIWRGLGHYSSYTIWPICLQQTSIQMQCHRPKSRGLEMLHINSKVLHLCRPPRATVQADPVQEHWGRWPRPVPCPIQSKGGPDHDFPTDSYNTRIPEKRVPQHPIPSLYTGRTDPGPSNSPFFSRLFFSPL